jgi:hypothetical protein
MSPRVDSDSPCSVGLHAYEDGRCRECGAPERDKVFEDVMKSPNPTPLLCRSAVRRWLLEVARRNRAQKFTRVSEDTLIALNAHVKAWCVEHVARMPSKGKTL